MSRILPWMVLLSLGCEPAEPTATSPDAAASMSNDGGAMMTNDGGVTVADAGGISDSGPPAASRVRQLGPATGGFVSQVVF